MSGDWCTSNNKVNSSSFLADAVKLKLQQECLEKASFAAIKNIKCSDRDLAQEIISMYKDKESERYEERERLNNVVFSTLNSLKQLKNEIKNEDRLRKLDIDLYRKSLVDLQKRIRTINEESEESLQKLSEDELLLTEEMKCLENKINDWNQPIAPSILKPAVRSVSKSYISNTDNSRQEVLMFQKFLEDHGGHTGGWSDEDHMLFLRLRNKSKRKLTFLSLLSQHLPDISADEMLLHEEWYQQYENLKSNQKKAIQEWKVSKSNNVKDETEVKIIQQRKTKPLEDPEKKKQLILEWKQTLQLKKELENQEEWDRKQKELEQIQKKREKQEIKKAEVERYKEEKLNQQHTNMVLKQLKELQELEERADQAKILLKAFQKQDQLFVARRLNRREQRMLKEEQRKKHIENLKEKIAVERNPSRLMQTTAAWRERCRQNSNQKISSIPMPHLHLKNMPHLQVPDWRRDVI